MLDGRDSMIGTREADVYFSVDVETDGPIPGPYSMLSFAVVYAGMYNGDHFRRADDYSDVFYTEIKPISDNYQSEALKVNGLDRDHLIAFAPKPSEAMERAYDWILGRTMGAAPVLVAYPLGFDWSWISWYFEAFCSRGSPFSHSRCFDLKTAVALTTGQTIARSGRSRLPAGLASNRSHTHHAVDDAIEQADIFANIFKWRKYEYR